MPMQAYGGGGSGWSALLSGRFNLGKDILYRRLGEGRRGRSRYDL